MFKNQKISILKILFYRTIREYTIHIFNNILYIQYLFNLITIFCKWENTKTKKKEDNKSKSYSSDKGIKIWLFISIKSNYISRN